MSEHGWFCVKRIAIEGVE